MTIRTFTIAAVAVLVAGAASAQSINPGDVQLALKAGVEPGAYSTSDLTRLLEAQRENRTGQINFILRGDNDIATRMSISMPASKPTASFGTNVHSNMY